SSSWRAPPPSAPGARASSSPRAAASPPLRGPSTSASSTPSRPAPSSPGGPSSPAASGPPPPRPCPPPVTDEIAGGVPTGHGRLATRAPHGRAEPIVLRFTGSGLRLSQSH
uniref:Uncharacterized protein n=1 Tax=Triticum urartu TaxID=4572 RepID=A0A8R7JY25_TRIUA